MRRRRIIGQGRQHVGGLGEDFHALWSGISRVEAGAEHFQGLSASRAEKISIKGCAGDACWQEAWRVEVPFGTLKKANRDPESVFRFPFD